MKFRGKAITGSSLLMMLGVVCFSTVLVAAFTLTSTLTINQTVSAAPTITISPTPIEGGNTYTDTEKTYTFSATPNMAVTNVQISVTVTKDSTYVTGDILDNKITVTIDSVQYAVTVTADGDATATGSIAGPATLSATEHAGCTAVLTYHNTGSYAIVITMTATAPDA